MACIPLVAHSPRLYASPCNYGLSRISAPFVTIIQRGSQPKTSSMFPPLKNSRCWSPNRFHFILYYQKSHSPQNPSCYIGVPMMGKDWLVGYGLLRPIQLCQYIRIHHIQKTISAVHSCLSQKQIARQFCVFSSLMLCHRSILI